MARRSSTKSLYTASQVARFCQVDLKTIHNWSERGKIRHFRTPGRHLRFRGPDLLDFLRKYGYPIPAELGQHRPRVVLLLGANGTSDKIAKALNESFEVQSYADPLRALVHLGADAPDAIVLAERLNGVPGIEIIAALKEEARTQHVRAVLFADNDTEREAALEAGASAHVRTSNIDGLKDTIEALMGVQR